jgi:hypothetical protein
MPLVKIVNTIITTDKKCNVLLMFSIIFYLKIFVNTLQKISAEMSHNVPAVYDVLPARIRACVARPGLAKCGWSGAWEA